MHLRIPPPLVVVILAAAMWFTREQLTFGNVASPWLAPLAAVLLLIASVLMAAAVVAFVRARTTINPMKPANASALITNGVYAMSRNPIYLADLLLLAALALWLANAVNLIYLPVLVWYLNRFQIEPEEAALRRLFGAPYAAYCAQVRRWL